MSTQPSNVALKSSLPLTVGTPIELTGQNFVDESNSAPIVVFTQGTTNTNVTASTYSDSDLTVLPPGSGTFTMAVEQSHGNGTNSSPSNSIGPFTIQP